MNVISMARPEPPSALRQTLAGCIADRQAAENAARTAKMVFERARVALAAAASEVQRLSSELSAKRDASIKEAADRLTRALREGREPPPSYLAMEHGSAALDAAQARMKACELSAAELQAESLKANEAFIRAAHAVRDIVEDILEQEAADAAIEVVSTMQAHERALDRLTGLVLRDERRPAPRLRQLQRAVIGQIDRRKRETARDQRLIETHNWQNYLDRIAEAEAKQWQDYANRLADDPTATIGTDQTDQGAAA